MIVKKTIITRNTPANCEYEEYNDEVDAPTECEYYKPITLDRIVEVEYV